MVQPKSVSGPEGTRTLDPHNAIVVLSQLSYRPIHVAKDNEKRLLILMNFQQRATGIACEPSTLARHERNPTPAAAWNHAITSAAPRRVRHSADFSAM